MTLGSHKALARITQAASVSAIILAAPAVIAQHNTLARGAGVGNSNQPQTRTPRNAIPGDPGVSRFVIGGAWDPLPTETMPLRFSIVPDGLELFDAGNNSLGDSNLLAQFDNAFGEGVTDEIADGDAFDPTDPRFDRGGREGNLNNPVDQGGWLRVFLSAFESPVQGQGFDTFNSWGDIANLTFAPGPSNLLTALRNGTVNVDGDNFFVAIPDAASTNPTPPGTAWFTEGQFTDPTALQFGDIRIGMAPLGTGPNESPFIVTGSNMNAMGDAGTMDELAGHIILDSDRISEFATFDPNALGAREQSGEFAFLLDALSEAVGRALGLLQACPQTGQPDGVDSVMEPGVLADPGSSLLGPFNEDIRAIQALYGDANEPNDTAANATPLLDNTSGGTFEPPLTPDGTAEVNGSIDDTDDVDVFTFFGGNPGNQFDITVTPQFGSQTVGTEMVDMGDCDPMSIETINTRELQNLVITLQPPMDPETMEIPDPIVVGDDGSAGDTVTTSVTIDMGQQGEWMLTIDSDTDTDEPPVRTVQPYRLTVDASMPDVPEITDDFSRFLNDSQRLDITMWSMVGLRDNTETTSVDETLDFEAQDPPLRRSVVGFLDFFEPNRDHVTLQVNGETPASRTAVWGADFPNPDNVTGAADAGFVNTHATATSAAATGDDFFGEPLPGSQEDIQFEGVAPESQFAFGIVSQDTIPEDDFGLFSIQAAYFSLFALTDPQMAQDLGLEEPVKIINASIGGGATGSTDGVNFIAGDGDLAIGIDAIVSMRDVTVILPVGNDGGLDQTSDCNPDAGDDGPGSDFVGSRTVTSPATSFNAIAVGSVASQLGGEMEGDDNDDNNEDRIRRVPSFSAKGPIDTTDFSGGEMETQTDARPGVHILAPGVGAITPSPLGDMLDCFPGVPITESLRVPSLGNETFTGALGTSISTPIVSGAVALMQDFNECRGDPEFFSSPLVMKACILNSGFKLQGWANDNVPGEPQIPPPEAGTTDPSAPGLDNIIQRDITQPLDFAQGTGYLNFRLLFEQFVGVVGDGDMEPTDLPCEVTTTDITRDSIFTPPDRSVVTRVFEGPMNPPPPGGFVMRPDGEQRGDLFDDFPSIDERGPSPFELRDRLAMAHAPERNIRALIDTGDFPVGGDGGGAGGTNFGPSIVTGPPGSTGGGGPLIVPPTIDDDTTDPQLPGEVPTRLVNPIVVKKDGWDIGQVGSRTVQGMGDTRIGFIDYIIPGFQLEDGGDVITATLVWNRRVTLEQPNFNNPNPSVGNSLLRELELENLDLRLFSTNDANEPGLEVASSTSTFNNIEHFTHQVGIPPGGQAFILRVEWVETEYDFFQNGELADVPFALAWRTTDLEDLGDDGSVFREGFEGDDMNATLPKGYDYNDLLDVVTSFGSRIFQDDAYSKDADVKFDGKINFEDLIQVLSNM